MLIYFVCSPIERKELIARAIEEVKAEFKAKEEAKKNRAMTQNEKEGKYTADQLLAKFFKKPSKLARNQGIAALRYEKMVRAAEKKLYEHRRKTMVNSQSVAAQAEALAEELFHKPGSILKTDELARMWQESECSEVREEPNCFFPTVNQFRTIDGTCNNLENPLFGAAGTAFRRLIPAQYEDGCSSLRGDLQNDDALRDVVKISPFVPPNPSARHISQTIIDNITTDEIPFTHILMQWGQFLDHDLDLGPELEEECEDCLVTEICHPIQVADADPAFGINTPNKGKCLPFRRSLPVCPTAPPLSFEAREQVNDLTSFIDGSMVYGSNDIIGDAVREFKGGLLRVGENFPANQPSLPVDNQFLVACPNRTDCFLCGDVRCNEQFSLTVMHTIWVREHNRCARELSRINPHWEDERLFQECRRIVGALIQKITYLDYLPKVMGPKNYDIFVGPYLGYNPEVDPGVPNAFATAAYRYGHSLVRPLFDRLGPNYRPLPIGPVNLVDMFFNPTQFNISLGTDPITRGLVTVNSRRMDEFMNRVLTTQLFQTKSSVGMDLASLNIQRGRGHGLPPYPIWKNFCNKIFGITSEFENDITKVRFLGLYGTLDTLDLWIGGLAEERLEDSLLGATFNCIFGLNFAAVRDGDRFYYSRPGVFTPQQLREIQQHTLSRVICDNSDNILSIQPDAFLSNQSRVRCDSLPALNFNEFKEVVCYYRVGVRPRQVPASISSFSRTVQSNFIFTELIVPPSRSQEFVCMQIQCPVGNTPTDVISFSPDGFRLIPDPSLPISSLNRPTSYRADWPRSQFDQGLGGVFFDLATCERSTQVAIEFGDRVMEVAAELEALETAKAAQDGNTADPTTDHHHSMKEKVPKEILNILGKSNPNAAKQELPAAKKASTTAEMASDSMLLKELENALKELN